MRRVWRVVLRGFCASLAAETIQLIYKVGTFDVDDLLLNTVGALAGYIVWRVLHWCMDTAKK